MQDVKLYFYTDTNVEFVGAVDDDSRVKFVHLIFELHQMREMQTIVTNDRGVCPSVSCHAAQLGFTVQKRLNGSRSCFWVNTRGA